MLIFFVLLLAVIRILCLANAPAWTSFPSTCDSHPEGCYRTDAYETGYKVDSIIDGNYNTSYIYSGDLDAMAYF